MADSTKAPGMVAKVLLVLAPLALVNLQGCSKVINLAKAGKCALTTTKKHLKIINETDACPADLPECLANISFSDIVDKSKHEDIVKECAKSALSARKKTMETKDQLCNECFPKVSDMMDAMGGCCEKAPELTHCGTLFGKTADTLDTACGEADDDEPTEAPPEEAALPTVASGNRAILVLAFVSGMLPSALLVKYFMGRSRSEEDQSYAMLG